MRHYLSGPALVGGLAVILMAGTANLGFAFQQTQDYPEGEGHPSPSHEENSHSGEFDSFGTGYIRMTVGGGKSHVHNVTEQTQVTIDGKPARLNNLRTGDRIEVSMGPNNVAMRIDVTRDGTKEGAAPGAGRPDFEEETPGRDNVQAKAEPTPWLGVVLNEAEEGQQGVQVTQTFPSGPAARAGLRGGDVLVQIAGQDVTSPEVAAQMIEKAKPNEPIELVVLRGDQRQTITATLGNRQDFLFEERLSNQNQGQGAEGFEFEGSHIPDHAMMLEQHRHFAAQHERIEEKLDQVLKELAALRKQMGQDPAVETPEPPTPEPLIPRGETPKDRTPEGDRSEAQETQGEIPEAPTP